jgi:hypothetical protein
MSIDKEFYPDLFEMFLSFGDLSEASDCQTVNQYNIYLDFITKFYGLNNSESMEVKKYFDDEFNSANIINQVLNS